MIIMTSKTTVKIQYNIVCHITSDPDDLNCPVFSHPRDL